MSKLRFHHVYAALVLLTGACALVVPTRAGEVLRRPVQGLFAPVSWPTHTIGRWLTQPRGGQAATDPSNPGRSVEQLIKENRELRLMLANLSGQLERLRERQAERERLGPVREFCTPARVSGTDSGSRQSIQINLGQIAGVEIGQPVLYWGGIVGRVSSVGPAGARVQLITDPHFKRFTARFARFVHNAQGQVELIHLATDPVLVEGGGTGTLLIRNQPARLILEEAKIQVNDWAVLSDTTDWPVVLQGYRVGRVVEIVPRRDVPGHVDLRLEPEGNLMGLSEVMVMNR